MSDRTALEVRITEVCYRASMKVLRGHPPAKIAAVADSLIGDVVETVLSQGTNETPPKVKCSYYSIFALFNEILDEIAKEIPCVDAICVYTQVVTRQELLAYKKARLLYGPLALGSSASSVEGS